MKNMEISFTKMHGIGNDFVVVNCLSAGSPSPQNLQENAVWLCDRKFGVGADIVLCVLPSEKADFLMRMFNPDGSEAEMCGNGIRCFGKFVYDRSLTQKRTLSVETPGGIKQLEMQVKNNEVSHVTVDMGEPGLTRAHLPMNGGPSGELALGQVVEVGGKTVALTGVSMGNPHVVFFPSSVTDEVINALGPILETHTLFPRRTNVHAVQVHGANEITLLTWERGAGRTLACGTGACASVVASHLNGHTERTVLAHLPGGDLQIHWAEDNHVYMTGAAQEVFTGVLELPH
jgi:diaminopimelate epimerase